MPLVETTTLPDGRRLRVRLPHGRDRLGLIALHERLGAPLGELELTRALRFDPRTRAVACATAWVDGGELLVGYGAITLGAEGPDLLVADDVLVPGVGRALAGALREGARRRDAA